jgi:AcrR family transcriptional regulator
MPWSTATPPSCSASRSTDDGLDTTAVSRSAARTDPTDNILDVVVDLLEANGYDGWQLRDVAERARASLATIYKHFPSRDELIVAAVERWMQDNIYQSIGEYHEGASVFDVLDQLFRAIFEPWERHPRMLQVFVQACATTGDARLRTQGVAAVEPLRQAFLNELDPTYAEDLDMILTNVTQGALKRYGKGEIAVTDILTALQRTLYRLGQAAPALDIHPSRSRTRPTTRTADRRRAGSRKDIAR